ncbi:TRAP transporter small permease [Elioraea tepida]|uniref:TRAP transporter small permease protein n=1 Tax=Elioraea tepida TaxID=2843330 RepID=A0A975U1V3_9PROT|nr:TRAP transporter small permease [Elioraea tepida]QXM24782.1 TRAP transporter small permease [Elioraea tepida]
MTSPPNPLVLRLRPATRLLAVLCGVWLLGYSLLVCVDIVARRYFGISLQGTDEIGGYTLAVLAAFGFAHALAERRHTRIELALAAMPRPLRALVNLLAAAAIAAFAVFAALRGRAVLGDSLFFMSVSNSPLQVPLWIPQGAWMAGLVTFAVVSVLQALHAALLALRGRAAQLNAWYGPPTIAEEIAAETGGALADQNGTGASR